MLIVLKLFLTQKAFNSLKYAFASVANMKNWMTGFVKLFGKRRRSYGSTLSESLESLDSSADYLLAEETPQLLREKRSSIGKCLNDSCPECKAFYNSAKHDSYWVYRRGECFFTKHAHALYKNYF